MTRSITPETFSRIGRPGFRLERAVARSLPFKAEVSCIVCGSPLTVEFGSYRPLFRIGVEVVGVSCDGCVDPESRELLARMRKEAAAQ